MFNVVQLCLRKKKLSQLILSTVHVETSFKKVGSLSMPKLGDSRAPPSSWFEMHVWPHLDCVLGQNLYINWKEPSLKLKGCGQPKIVWPAAVYM